MRATLLTALAAVMLALTACTSAPDVAPTSSETPTPSATTAAMAHSIAEAVDEDLRAELLAMLERDQAERLEGTQTEGDQTRTERLKEIIAEHGWPSISLVGEDGEDAAWAIAQHSDLDPEFQREALEYLRAAVDAGDASLGNLAYLEDRIAVAAGEPQRYGTQIGCGPDGPEPATPLIDAAAVDDLRRAAGLPPLDDYLAEVAEFC